MNIDGTGTLVEYRTDYYPHTGGYNEGWTAPIGDPFDHVDNDERYIGDNENAVEDFDEHDGDGSYSSDEE